MSFFGNMVVLTRFSIHSAKIAMKPMLGQKLRMQGDWLTALQGDGLTAFFGEVGARRAIGSLSERNRRKRTFPRLTI